MLEPIVLLWSGGKDSALALQSIREAGRFRVHALLTTVTEGFDRISIHGVRRSLLQAQADSLGLPLKTAEIPKSCSNADYEAVMTRVLSELSGNGIGTVAAGDIFLEDVRLYRERLLERAGMKASFPLWHRDTGGLALEFISSGFRASVACVDTFALDGSFAGRAFDAQFLADLPESVDPCGENGEFHTFVGDGPPFRCPVAFEAGEKVLRDERFRYCDLLPRRGAGYQRQ
ncbi:MAG: diphthine--ammonia ligase [Trueperaceae bacterium]